MTQEQLMEQAEFLRDQQREDGEVRSPEQLLTILDKELADMKSKGVA
jgi:hypothetical protein